MKKLILFGLALSVLTAQSVFAQDLGVLGDGNKPQNLVSAQELLNTLNSAISSGSQDRNRLNANETNVRSRGYYGGGYYNWYPSYYPSYYYPYYSYPYYYGSYYPYYNYGYGYGRHHRRLNDTSNLNTPAMLEGSDDSSGDSNDTSTDSNSLNEGQTPVVCFASNESGNWYAMADVASNVLSTQQSANNECLASGSNCHQNLGCAIAFR